MAEKKVKSVLIKHTQERVNNLQNTKGEYEVYGKPLDISMSTVYKLYENENSSIHQYQHPDILRYTHNEENEYSKDLHEKYGIDDEKLKYYSHVNIKPSYRVNTYDGFDDYISYVWDTYGREESYAGYLMGLMGVRDLAENLVYDIVPDFRGKTAQDVINEILQYDDINYALEKDKVGIVRDINVAMAINGNVTTNINNYTGKETKMGMISNRMYASTLLLGAQFNTMRRTRYITPELSQLYGNNLNNVYNLSSLFRVNDETGRIIEPDSNYYLGMDMPYDKVSDYLFSINPEYTGDETLYGNNSKYFDIFSSENGEYNIPDVNDWTFRSMDKQIHRSQTNDTFRVYSEGDDAGDGVIFFDNPEVNNGNLSTPLVELEHEDLLTKTNRFLLERKCNTLISRFHNKADVENNMTQTSVYRNFGISHGRNLLTKGSYENGVPSNYVNGYSNPYCRVWTNHCQYSKMKHLIRPFIDDEKFMTIEELQQDWFMFRAKDGGKRLSDYGVLNKNGMVNITPSAKSNIDIKQCMFSIENLAWKDVLVENGGRYDERKIFRDESDNQDKIIYNSDLKDNEPVLSQEQRGPNGGRIMWFPPYDLTFQETAKANWSSNDFIGRGEPVYTYTNSARSGTLEFTLLVDHPSVVNYWLKDKLNASEDEEQTLLRFFAGCEAITPSEDVLEHLENGVYVGGTKDPVEVEEEKDIVFYTFFPNNYSGVDYGDDPDEAIDILFGGHINNKNVFFTLNAKNDIPRIELKNYNITIPENGETIEIEYKIRNSSDNITVEISHDTFGVIESYSIENNVLLIKTTDNLSGVRYARIKLSLNGAEDKEISLLQKGVNGKTDFDEFWYVSNSEGIDASVVSDDKFYLGYEMGVNPISVNSFSLVEEKRDDTYFLDNIYDYSSAEATFGDLSSFKENLEISKFDVLTCEFKNYENLKMQVSEKVKKDTEYTTKFREAQKLGLNNANEIEKLIAEKTQLEETLQTVEEGTSRYNSLNIQISSLESKIKKLEEVDRSGEKYADVLTKKQEANFKEVIEGNNKIAEIEDFFIPTNEYNKTNPLFIYYENNGKDDGVTVCETAQEAYAKYQMSNIKSITTESIDDTPYEFLAEKDKLVCKTIYPEGESYWFVELTESDKIPYLFVKSKRKFIKSDFDFGTNNTAYYVKFNGETREFSKPRDGKTAKEQADYFILMNNILPQMTKDEFARSGKLYAQDPKTYRFYYYNLIKTSREYAEGLIVKSLKIEAENAKKEGQNTNDYIIEKYYKNNKYGCISEMGDTTNYGVIQFFFTAKMQETGESYENVQDFIARHNFKENSLKPQPSPEDTVLQYEASGCTKYVTTKQEGDDRGYVTVEINWDIENPSWHYPIDKEKETEDLHKKNYYDMESFGLNSTLEVVKKEMGDENVTFSFGEVYAALHGEDEEKFVLACERGILKSRLGYTGEELESKVKEAEDRIAYLKMVFNPKEGVSNFQVKEIKTLGTASSQGVESRNVGLSNNRETTLQKFLKKLPIMKNVNDVGSLSFDKDGKTTNEIIRVSKAESNDISGISAKKGRCSKVSIIIGEKDLTVEQKKELEKERNMTKEEKRLRYQRRYDNERLFFEMLEETDNVAYNRLIDKVKYFSPAFHSITPEGFNARLTFLHQCTRQGPTRTSSDKENSISAYNLAFGRAPFCVLRLGDFLNTKIIIESVNITYPDSMWDLNPEGIGVQFMMAKVSMQIQIIGGSDISTPIKRLQNAVSFNYYANTSIYDNRSDTAEYIGGNQILDTKTWHPNMNIVRE